MRLSAEETNPISEERAWAADQVERTTLLFDVQETFASDKILGLRMTPVGGTALNAFRAGVSRERTPPAS